MSSPEFLVSNKMMDGKPQEACGIVAVAPKTEDAIGLTHAGVMSIHNRGEDGTGIAVFDPDLKIIKHAGKTDRAFKGGRLLQNLGETAVALGHVHYNTDEADPERSLQPFGQGDFALAHNGQFTNSRRIAERSGVDANGGSDSEIVSQIIKKKKEHLGSIEQALEEVLPSLAGAFSIVIAEANRLIAVRDRRGLRPLNIGRLADGGYGVCSESAYFDLVGGELERAVSPGTYVVINQDSVQEHRWSKEEWATCALEFAYFSRADSFIDGVEVARSRYAMGQFLAQDHPRDVDIVIPMPDSGRHAATGYAHTLGIPQDDGFYRNNDIGRVYTKPRSNSRSNLARIKNNPIASVVSGNGIALVDDSIIRGDTSTRAIEALRDQGATEVHCLSAFPKVISECYYGMNMRKPDGLIAIGRSDREIARAIGADSVGYLSVERNEEATSKQGLLCRGCTMGEYPEPIEDEMTEVVQVND